MGVGWGPSDGGPWLGAGRRGRGLGTAGRKVAGTELGAGPGLASSRPGHGLHVLETLQARPVARGARGGAWRGTRGRPIRGRHIKSGMGIVAPRAGAHRPRLSLIQAVNNPYKEGSIFRGAVISPGTTHWHPNRRRRSSLYASPPNIFFLTTMTNGHIVKP